MRQRGRKQKAREISDTNIRVGKRYVHRPQRTVSKFPQRNLSSHGNPRLTSRMKVQKLRTYYFKHTPGTTKTVEPPEPGAHEHTDIRLMAAAKTAAVTLVIVSGLVLSTGLASML